MSRTSLFTLAAIVALLSLTGCLYGPANPRATARVTKVDPAQATPDYWLDQPAVAAASNPDFYKLWDACRLEMRNRFFTVDRADFRDGVLTTQPLVSKQFFEFWRADIVTANGIADSSLGTIRRTVRFAIEKDPALGYVARPKVLVERLASVERRLTTISEYHQAFGGVRTVTSSEAESGAATLLPDDYWYSIGRDPTLEKSLATSIQGHLRG